MADSVEYQLTHQNESRQGEIRAMQITLTTLVTIFVALRFTARHITRNFLGWDDWVIFFALLLSYGMAACSLICVSHGLGRHLFDLDILDVEKSNLAQFVYSLLYTIVLPTIKLSIILFYLRVFPVRKMRIVCYCFMAFIVVWSLSALLVAINNCAPIRYFWDKSAGGGNGHCINFYAFILAEAILTVLTDFVLLIIPMPMVWQLQIPRRQKIAVSGIFLLGGFVCVTSIVRIPSIKALFGDDPTWTSYTTAVWSLLEVNLGIICACLPTLRPIVRKLLPAGLPSVSRSGTRNSTKKGTRSSGLSSMPSLKSGALHNLSRPGSTELPRSFQPASPNSDGTEKSSDAVMTPQDSPPMTGDAEKRFADEEHAYVLFEADHHQADRAWDDSDDEGDEDERSEGREKGKDKGKEKSEAPDGVVIDRGVLGVNREEWCDVDL